MGKYYCGNDGRQKERVEYNGKKGKEIGKEQEGKEKDD